MVSGKTCLGLLLALGLGACSDARPGESTELEGSDIIGGQTDTTHKGVFGIVIKNQALCSGSLIAPNLLLTARHCVADISTGDAPVDCDTSDFGANYAPSSFVVTWDADLTDSAASTAYGVTAVRAPTPTDICGNDIALLILDTNVPSSAAATIAPRVDAKPETYEPFSAVGYGLTDPNDAQGVTAGVRHGIGGLEVGCVGALECAGSRATDKEWAANAPICHGDSGGPALDADGRVIGVASRADEECALGLYSMVASWRALVVDTAIEAAEDGGYEPPDWTNTEPTAGTGGSSGGGGTGGTSGASGKGGSGATSSGANGGTGATGGSNASGGASTGGTGATGGTSTTGGRGGRGSGGTGGTGTAGRGSGGTGATQDAGTPLPDSGTPTNLPLAGDECSGPCAGDLVCYSETGDPPGTCTPSCSESDKICPSKTKCDTDLGACIPKTSSSGDDDDEPNNSSGCGCRIGGETSSSASSWPALGLFAALGSVIRRRRRR